MPDNRAASIQPRLPACAFQVADQPANAWASSDPSQDPMAPAKPQSCASSQAPCASRASVAGPASSTREASRAMASSQPNSSWSAE